MMRDMFERKPASATLVLRRARSFAALLRMNAKGGTAV
jgi:hypothetical protein